MNIIAKLWAKSQYQDIRNRCYFAFNLHLLHLTFNIYFP